MIINYISLYLHKKKIKIYLLNTYIYTWYFVNYILLKSLVFDADEFNYQNKINLIKNGIIFLSCFLFFIILLFLFNLFSLVQDINTHFSSRILL